MSSSNPDLRRQGNRQWAKLPSCGRKPRNFCSNFHRRVSRMARDKKDVSGFLASVVSFNWRKHRETRKREKVRREKEGRKLFSRSGNYFRSVGKLNETLRDRRGKGGARARRRVINSSFKSRREFRVMMSVNLCCVETWETALVRR